MLLRYVYKVNVIFLDELDLTSDVIMIVLISELVTPPFLDYV